MKAKLSLLRRLIKRKDKANLSEIEQSNIRDHVVPVDFSKQVLEQDGKDKRLFKFYDFYRKRDFHDRFLKSAYLLLILSFVFSLASCYLSFPYLETYLTTDVPNKTFRFGVVVFILVLIELVKHGSLNEVFKTHYTYYQTPIIPVIFLVVACGLSIYFLQNGVEESSKQQAEKEKPKIEEIATIYDAEILALEKTNEDLKGGKKLNQWSVAGQTHADNVAIISQFRIKALAARDSIYKTKNVAFNIDHQQKSTFRKYGGFGVEFLIIFCGGWFLYYMYRSHREHTLRTQNKYLFDMGGHQQINIPLNPHDIGIPSIGFQQSNASNPQQNKPPQNPPIAPQIDNSNSTDNINTDKAITDVRNYTNEDLKNLIKVQRIKYNSYNWKLKNNKGTEGNNRSKMNEAKQEIERLESLMQIKKEGVKL